MPSKALGARQNSTIARRSEAPAAPLHVRSAPAILADAQLLQRLAVGAYRVRPAEILALQRAAGNRAVAQALRRAPCTSTRMSISWLGGARRRVQRYELLDKGLDNWKSGTSEGLFGWGGRSGYKAVDAALAQWDSVKNGKDAKTKIAALDMLSNRIKQWQGAKGWATSGKKAAKLLQEVEEERPKQEAQAKVQAAIDKILNTHKFQVAVKQWTLGELNGIDARLATFKTTIDGLKTGNDYSAKLTGFNKLKPELATWLTGKGVFTGPKPWLPDVVQNEVEKWTVAARIEKNYGIKIDQQAGIDAIKAQYTSVPAGELNKLKARDWALDELQDLETTLGKYAGLLGANRDVKKFGAQPLTTFSRLEQAIDTNTPSGKLDTTTLGETFTGSKNVSMFDVKSSDFAADPTAPTAAETRQGYRATIAHELSHALIEGIKSGKTTIIAKFATLFGFWNGKLYASAYWRDNKGKKIKVGGFDCDFNQTKAAAKKSKLEPPPTHYGTTTAKEDLAETMMLYLEAEAKLQGDCPKRHTFVKNNIAPLLKAP